MDARGASGVLVGELGTQINYFYNGTWTDGVAPPPLIGVSGAIPSPYRGLSAFEERDAGLFFGREAGAFQVLELVSRSLRGAGVVVVSGVSGAGKSSLVRAGVLPRFRGAGLASLPQAAAWPCVVMTPGPSPLEELAVRIAPLAGADAAVIGRGLAADPAGFALTARQAAIASAGGHARGAEAADEAGQRIMLVVDQGEQLFTQCHDEGQRQAFTAALHAAATARPGSGQWPAAVVILVIRADFEARLAEYPVLAAAVQDRYLLTSMTERQLRMAITQPATTVGASVDDDLVHVLLEEVRARAASSLAAGVPGPAVAGAGVLPLLSHALDQAWRHRAGKALTLADYERTGGIEGAVADSADSAYARLTSGQKAAARQVFTRLTAATAAGLDVAVRASREDLTAGTDGARAHDVAAVLETFAAERLLTLAADSVEISHEALLTAWPLLRDTWLAASHADRLVRTELQAATGEWGRASRDPAYLYSGSRLETAEDTAARINADARQTPLSTTEEGFLHASRGAAQRRARRRQALTATLLALVVCLAAVAAVAIRNGQDVANQRDIYISGQLAAQSEAAGYTSATASDVESIAAWGIDPSSQARYALLSAAARPEVATITAPGAFVGSLAFSPDGKILAGSGDGTTRLWNVSTGDQVGQTITDGTGSTQVAFSTDGTALTTGASSGARSWSAVTGQAMGQPLPSGLGNNDSHEVALSTDGRTLAISSGLTAWLWNVPAARRIAGPFTAPGSNKDYDSIESMAVSRDGKALAFESDAKTRTGYVIQVLREDQAGTWTERPFPGPAADSFAFSPDGEVLAEGVGGNVELWNVATGRLIGKTLTTGTELDSIDAMAFSPDGKLLAVNVSGGAGSGGMIVSWDVNTGRQVGFPITVGTVDVDSLAFSPSGNLLATGGTDGIVRLWSLPSTAGRLITNPSSQDSTNSLAFSPDGDLLATGDNNGALRLWYSATGRQAGKPLTEDPWAGGITVAFSPREDLLGEADANGNVEVWDAATRKIIDRAIINRDNVYECYYNYPSCPWVDSLAFSPDGKLLAVGDTDGRALLLSTASGRQVGKALTGTNGSLEVDSVAFSPSGKLLAVGSSGGTVRLFNVATGSQAGRSFGADNSSVNSEIFSPDGGTLATGSADGTARLWDVATGQEIGLPLTADIGVIYSVAFSPDGGTLATGSADGTARLWDVATGQEIGLPLTGDAGSIYSVAFSPDGTLLAAAGSNGATWLWNVSYLGNALARLCSQIGGSLTVRQWDRYVPAGPGYRDTCRGA